MRAVYRHANSATHCNAVDERDVWLSVILNGGVERIFVTPELQRLRVAARLAEIIERANVAAGREGAVTCAGNDDPCDRCVLCPAVKLGAQGKHHGMRDGIKCFRPVERDDARGSAPLE